MTNRSSAKFLRLLFAGILCVAAWARAEAAVSSGSGENATSHMTVGVNYVAERTNYVENGADLWTHGAGADFTYAFPWKLSAVARFTGVHCTGNYGESGIGILTFTAGPRYTQPLPAWRWLRGQPTEVYAQQLVGLAHGFDGLFPNSASVATTANSLASETGGGIQIEWKHSLVLHPIELDYLHTGFPNGTTSAQNQFVLGAGIEFHLERILGSGKK